MNLLRFIRKRAGYHWQIFLTLLLGVVFAISLLASGPFIINTVINIALPYKLHSSEPLDGNIRLTTYEKFAVKEYFEYDAFIRDLLGKHLEEYITSIYGGGNAGYLYPWIDGLLVGDHRISLGYYQELQMNAHLTAGEWIIKPIAEDKIVRVVISEVLAYDYNLTIGDRLPLSYSINESEPSIWFVISGIISPNQTQDSYWFGSFNPLLKRFIGRWSSYSAFVSEDDFFEISHKIFPDARSELYWNVILDPNKISVDQINIFKSRLNILRFDMSDATPKINTATSIDNILDDFSSRSRIVRLTLYILIGEVLFLSIYYITMIANLFSEYLGAEFSNLSSRGSSFKNIFYIQMSEVFVISGIGLVLGTLLAYGIVLCNTIIGPLATFNISIFKLRMPSTSLIAACLGILLCVFSLLIPTGKALKRSIVIHSRELSRKDRSPFWQKYYLDIFVFFIGLVLLWRLYTFGGLSAADRGDSIDWLLLLTPLILLIGSATFLFRIFPFLVKGLSRLFAHGRGFSTTIALYYISRNPSNMSRLALLLILTMALGVLTSGMNATLDASEYERALYANGSPVRYEFNPSSQGENFVVYSKTDPTSAVYRSNGSLNIRVHRIVPSFELLAIDPYTFVEVTKFRSDYATKPMGQVLGNLVVDIREFEYPSLYLPGQPVALGVWILNDTLLYEDNKFIKLVAFRGKIQTAQEEVFNINFQQISPGYEGTNESPIEKQWLYYEADLPLLNDQSYPLSLHSIWFNIRSDDLFRISLLLDDISLKYKNNEIVIIDDFEYPVKIWRMNDIAAKAIYAKDDFAHSGTGYLSLILPRTRSKQWGIGLFQAGKLTSLSIPVLASEEFLRVTELDIGNYIYGDVNSIRIPMVIVERVNYFPTLYDQPGQGFLVLPLGPLLIYLNQETVKPFNVNELWLNSSNTELINIIDEQFPNISRKQTIEEVRTSIKADPLSLGLRGILTISFFLSIILSVVGFSSYFYINALSREIQFGILRSLGMSIKQLYAMLFIEQAFLILISLTIGLLLGLLINTIILPGLPISLSEQPPVPPFLPHSDWTSIITLYVIITIIFIITLGISTLFLWKAKVHKVLRIGME